ncbi:MAG: hypothetical protein WAM25_12795 [Candidatus Acidiferrales bacterium]
MSPPRAEYASRLESRREIVRAKEVLHARVGNAKLGTIVVGLIVAWLAFADHFFAGYWLALPIAAYACLALAHEFVLRARARAAGAASFYERGIARIEDTWSGTGATGERFRDSKHVYSDDLDLFGKGCLFELLSQARLPMGEECLARWLLSPSPVPAIHERHSVIAELRGRLDLREALALIGEDLRVRLDPRSLIAWAERPALLPGGTSGVLLRLLAALLSLCAAGAIGYFFLTAKLLPILVVLVVEAALLRLLRPRAMRVVSSMAANAEGLELFSKILERLEQEPFTSPRLQGFAAELKRGGETASEAIRRLAGVVYWVDARTGLLAQIMELPFLYTVQTAMAAEAWRRQWGSRLRAWVEITGELEALLSLAGYSYEHPDDPFPEFVVREQGASAVFVGEQLGHPLIPAATCVRNDVQFDAATRVLLVSGSNMSGKSTYLRTAGISAVLAMAGAPIRGSSLRLSSLSLGTSIRRVDSLQENRSSFYTEILRIKDVFELTAGAAPVLFLFDELLEGTNSNDRKIGAEGLLRALVERGAMGIVTTHDLALTETTAALPGAARNVHFQDYVVSGEMRFDYKLREGVVAKSNALELMRLIGLKV